MYIVFVVAQSSFFFFLLFSSFLRVLCGYLVVSGIPDIFKDANVS